MTGGLYKDASTKEKGTNVLFHFHNMIYGNTCNRTKTQHGEKGIQSEQSSSHNADCVHIPGDMGRHAHRYGTDTL